MNNQYDMIEAQLADIWRQLHANDRALEEGGVFETEGLEEKVKQVCGDVTSLPKEDAVRFDAELKRLIEFLTDLSARMEERQMTLKSDVNALNQREKALHAYGKQAVTKKPKPDNS